MAVVVRESIMKHGIESIFFDAIDPRLGAFSDVWWCFDRVCSNMLSPIVADVAQTCTQEGNTLLSFANNSGTGVTCVNWIVLVQSCTPPSHISICLKCWFKSWTTFVHSLHATNRYINTKRNPSNHSAPKPLPRCSMISMYGIFMYIYLHLADFWGKSC